MPRTERTADVRTPERRMPPPSTVHHISPTELAARRARGEAIILVDVREVWEWELARIAGARLLPLSDFARAATELPADAEIVLYCHHGVRSLAATQFLAARGFSRVANLSGGIDRYSSEVDPQIPRY